MTIYQVKELGRLLDRNASIVIMVGDALNLDNGLKEPLYLNLQGIKEGKAPQDTIFLFDNNATARAIDTTHHQVMVTTRLGLREVFTSTGESKVSWILGTIPTLAVLDFGDLVDGEAILAPATHKHVYKFGILVLHGDYKSVMAEIANGKILTHGINGTITKPQVGEYDGNPLVICWHYEGTIYIVPWDDITYQGCIPLTQIVTKKQNPYG